MEGGGSYAGLIFLLADVVLFALPSERGGGKAGRDPQMHISKSNDFKFLFDRSNGGPEMIRKKNKEIEFQSCQPSILRRAWFFILAFAAVLAVTFITHWPAWILEALCSK